MLTFLRKSVLISPYVLLKGLFLDPSDQNGEGVILRELTEGFEIPKTFVEFGFSGWEFNCASLRNDWNGLLVDGDQYNVRISNLINPKSIESRRIWLTLENINLITNWVDARSLGVLSVDVDGNDYWFIEALIDLRPYIIIAEYNWVFGARRIVVPYDPKFERRVAHPSGNYYGASLSALDSLMARNGYFLARVDSHGVNAFFLRADIFLGAIPVLSASSAYREQVNQTIYGSTEKRWAEISCLPYVQV